MKPSQWLFLFSLILLFPISLYAAQETNSVEARIKTLMLDPNTQSPIVVLETVTDKKLLPIWIDVPEARAIALELEHVTTPRPLTHDLIRNIIQGLGATLQRVVITDLRNNTYFAVLSLGIQRSGLPNRCAAERRYRRRFKIESSHLRVDSGIGEIQVAAGANRPRQRAAKTAGHPSAGSNRGGRGASGHLISKGRSRS